MYPGPPAPGAATTTSDALQLVSQSADGLRVAVASNPDLARMLAELGREEDLLKLFDLRRLQVLERRRAEDVVG